MRARNRTRSHRPLAAAAATVVAAALGAGPAPAAEEPAVALVGGEAIRAAYLEGYLSLRPPEGIRR